MSDMRITGGFSPYPAAKTPRMEAPQPAQTEQAPAPPRPEPPKEDAEIQSLREMIQQAREKAEERREQLKLPKNTRYGDGPMEAYARLARARNAAQVSSAAGFARRRIAQLRTALRQDSENAPQIKAAIGQLQKALGRAGKKKRDLEQERIAEVRRRKAQAQQRDREAQRLKTELGRRRSLRSIREGGYIREAEIDSRMQRHMAAVRMELRQQAQDLAAAYPPQAAGQYAQYAAPAEAPAPQMDIQA